MMVKKRNVVFTVIIFSIALLASIDQAFSFEGRTHHPKIQDWYVPVGDARFDRVRYVDVSRAARARYKGVRPKITKRSSTEYPDCFDVRFLYKNELKRLTANCAGSKRYLDPRKNKQY